MTTYVDPLCKHGFVFDRRINSKPVRTCHLFEHFNDKNKLIDFAVRIGMLSRWIRKSNSGLWHFDLMVSKRELAISEGAIEVSRKEAVEHWLRIRNL